LSGKKLNVGPSPIWRKDGWIAIDHKPSRVDQPTILGDASNIPLDDKSCSIVFCSHVFEHIPHYKLEQILVEFNRVLEKNGTVRILTPDLYVVAKSYVEKDKEMFDKLISEDENVRTDLGLGGTFMNFIISPGQDTALFNKSLTEFIGGYAHVYLYDFEMLKTLFEKYGFKAEQKKFCESNIQDFSEPLHVESMDPVWVDLNKEFFSKHNFVHSYNEKERKYETNFAVTGFDRDPVASLIIEATKIDDVNELKISDKRGYSYSKSLLDDKNFELKTKIITSTSKILEDKLEDQN
jgi:hypothetical protein